MQPKTVFEMPVDITIETQIESETFVFQNDQREQAFEFMVTGEPISVKLDKDNWILKFVDEISQPIFLVRQSGLTDDNGQPVSSFAPGATGRLVFSVQNMGVSAQNVSMTVSSESSAIEFQTAQVDFDVVQPGGVLSNENNPFEFTISSTALDQLAFVDFRVNYDGGSSKVHSISLPIGSPTLLLVDDDAGADYEDYFTSYALQSAEFAAVWSIHDQGIPSLEELQKVSSVLWFTGDDSLSSLTKDEQHLIKSYLDNGGRLLLTGQSIGYDLVEDGDDADAEFFTSVLHADYSPEILSDMAIVGQPGDVIGDRLTLRFEDQFDGAGNQNRLRALAPLDAAVTSFMYLPSRNSAGIRFEDDQKRSKLVYLAFGLEGAEGPKETSAAELLRKAIDWLVTVTDVEEEIQSSVPTNFVVEQNYPNPFNPSTMIRFFAPEKSTITVVIYNALGQKVRHLNDGLFETGWHTLEWDGLSDDGLATAGGIYFLQIQRKYENKMASKSVKMLKIN
jgi:hypothetical protein